MSFRRFAVTAVIGSITLLGCGNKIPVESPTGAGSTEGASQASKASADEIKAKLENDRSGKSDRGHDKGWKRRIAALTDSLGLSEEQVEDLNELYDEYQTEIKALYDSARASDDRSGLREQLRDSRQAFDEDFNDVLTDDQKARLAEIRANAAARRKDTGWKKYIAALTDSLDLNDQQVTDLNELHEDYQADMKAAIDNARESDDRSGLRDKLRELKEDFDEDFNALLTAEQKEKLDEMKSGKRKRSGKDHGHGRKGRSG